MADTPLSIGLVTPDFAGITHNGGIGTAFYNLAVLLAQHHHVTVFYADEAWVDNSERPLTYWVDEFKKLNITLLSLPPLPETEAFSSSPHDKVLTSLRVYRWLKDHHATHPLDVIHFPDWLGLGYFTLLAKRQGFAFEGVNMCVQAHSPVFWHRLHNKEAIDEVSFLHINDMEMKAVALADKVISPSAYMLEWYKEAGVALPECQVIQNVLLAPPLATSPKWMKAEDIKEIVLFGRLEIRKGVELFCEALKHVDPALLAGKTITFLGKNSLIYGKPSVEFIQEHMENLGITWKIEGNFNTHEAVSYLQQAGRVTVIASLVENSPYVVLEALGYRLPFLASDTGGTAELIHPDDQANVLFIPKTDILAAQLQNILTQGVHYAAPALPIEVTQQQWLALHSTMRKRYSTNTSNVLASLRATNGSAAIQKPQNHWIAASPSAPRNDGSNKSQWGISICLWHEGESAAWEELLHSVARQSLLPSDIYIMHSGATPVAVEAWQRMVGNHIPLVDIQMDIDALPAQAKGEYVFFLTTNHQLKPDSLEAMAGVIRHTRAESISCLEQTFPLLDNTLPFTGVTNGFGGKNIAVQTATLKALLPTLPKNEDFLLALRVNTALYGHHHETIPECLLGYTAVTDTEALRGIALTQYIHKYPELRELLLFCHGTGTHKPAIMRLNQEVSRLEWEKKHLLAEIELLRNAEATQRHIREAIENSTSWKVTAPLRSLKQTIRKTNETTA